MNTEATTIIQQLRAASIAYYNDQPTMTDAQFDALVDRLRQIDPANPFLGEIGAPAARRTKVTHTIPMLSLDKVTTAAELRDFLASVASADDSDSIYYTLTPKLDGSSIEIRYENGNLVEASTRGNGEVGDDITVNVRKVKGVLHTLKHAINCCVRGECVLSFEDWPLIDPTKATNPRNAGNGKLNNDDGEGCEHLTFRPFDIVGTNETTEQQKIETLSSLGFVPAESVTCSANSLEALIARWAVRRPDYEFPIDGVVIKVNHMATQKVMGIGSNRPRAQVAFKWPSDVAVTKLVGVELSVGHTGQIIPTGILEPVQLMGTTVERVMLNNWNEIAKLGVEIGDSVHVTKRGDIIPKVESVAAKGTLRMPIFEPTECPVCKGKASRKGASAQTFCLNDDCAAKTTGKVKRWVKSLDILGLGDDLLVNLTAQKASLIAEAGFDTALVSDPADLYTLDVADLAACRMGKGVVGNKRAAGIIAEINKTRTLTLDQFLGSLGLPFLGKRRVEIIRKASDGTLDRLTPWFDGTLRRFAAQVGIPGTIDEIEGALADIKPLVDKLLQHVTIVVDVKIKPAAAPEKIAFTPAIAEAMKTMKQTYTFVLTGKFDRPKAEIHAEIEAAGHHYGEDMRKGVTTHLVVADSSAVSNKSKKATDWGIPTITLGEMRTML